MKINFKVKLKKEDRIVYPIGFCMNQFDENIIRLYLEDRNCKGSYIGMPYHVSEIEIQELTQER